jgi:hypothetical protein
MSIVQVPDVGEVRRQLKHAIDAHKRANVARRADSDQATKQFETWFQMVGEPLCREFTSALRGEGYQFRLETPQGAARISSERSADDFLELAFDSRRTPVALVLSRGYTRGSKTFTDQRVLCEGPRIDQVEPQQVLSALVEDILPLVER